MDRAKKPEAQRPSNRSHKSSGHAKNGTAKAQLKPASTAVTTMDRRAAGDRRAASDRRKSDHPVAVERRKLHRRVKVSRRRQIDPTTCERDYTDEELEFMGALDAYKRSSGRMFPTCSEILEVLRDLGYEKRPAAPPIPQPPAPLAEVSSGQALLTQTQPGSQAAPAVLQTS